jgi:hypothetical protein
MGAASAPLPLAQALPAHRWAPARASARA